MDKAEQMISEELCKLKVQIEWGIVHFLLIEKNIKRIK